MGRFHVTVDSALNGDTGSLLLCSLSTLLSSKPFLFTCCFATRHAQKPPKRGAKKTFFLCTLIIPGHFVIGVESYHRLNNSAMLRENTLEWCISKPCYPAIFDVALWGLDDFYQDKVEFLTLKFFS